MRPVVASSVSPAGSAGEMLYEVTVPVTVGLTGVSAAFNRKFCGVVYVSPLGAGTGGGGGVLPPPRLLPPPPPPPQPAITMKKNRQIMLRERRLSASTDGRPSLECYFR